MNVDKTARGPPMLWGYAIAFWDSIGLRTMVGGAILGILALGVSLFSSFVLWRVAGVAQADLGTKTAALDAQVEAQRTLTAEAQERAAVLEKEAARVRLEQEQLKAQLAWRVIPTAMAVELERVLAATHGSVNLRWVDGDPEALYFALQFSQIFAKAGWHVGPGAWKPAGSLVFGIFIPDDASRDTDDSKVLKQAFAAADVSYGTQSISSAGVGFSMMTIPNAPTLMIGSKAPGELPVMPLQ